jgi:hypothetical protein
MTTYHCTWTRLLPRIRKQGLRTMQTSNWATRAGKRQGGGLVFAFASRWDAIRWAAKMDWEFNRTHGSGEVSILTLEHAGAWQTDDTDPLSQAICEDRWLKTGAVPASAIVGVETLTGDMVRALIQHQNQMFQEVK